MKHSFSFYIVHSPLRFRLEDGDAMLCQVWPQQQADSRICRLWALIASQQKMPSLKMREGVSCKEEAPMLGLPCTVHASAACSI